MKKNVIREMKDCEVLFEGFKQLLIERGFLYKDEQSRVKYCVERYMYLNKQLKD